MPKIYEKLAVIQAKLKAPKTQENKFGGYKYRKAEDILEAVKPLLAEQGCLLNCTDELLLIGDRYYIRATAVIICVEDGSEIRTTAFAREEQDKKGMDQSQVTGASSSYARKYALNGLLCIDDTADSDTTNVGADLADQKKGGKKAAAAGTPAKVGKTADKPAAPARGSAEWIGWVRAIATKQPGKSGQPVDWMANFKNHYAWDQDLVDCLEEDVFNFRMDAPAVNA